MKGRLEHKLKTEKNILSIIEKIDPNYHLFEFYNYISSKYEHKSKYVYIQYIIKFLTVMGCEVKIITSNDINKYLNNIMYKKINGILLETSGTYRATIHSALSLYFSFLYDYKYINNNPMLNVSRPKNKRNDQIERIFLTPDEIQILINNAKNNSKNKDRDLLILMTFLYTGMRCTALTEINVDDIDINDKTLTVVDKRNKKRTFILDDAYIELFLKVKKHRNYSGDALFVGNNGHRISESAISKMLKRYSAGINKSLSPHKLRRSYGTNLYNKTGDLYLVKNALGHEDIKTTQLYVIGDNTAAAEKGMNAMKDEVKF